MDINQGKKAKGETENDAAKSAATSDLNYRFNMLVNRVQMLDFQHQCKLRGTDASTRLRQFVDSQLEIWRKE